MLLGRSAYTEMWKYRVCMRVEINFCQTQHIIRTKKKKAPWAHPDVFTHVRKDYLVSCL